MTLRRQRRLIRRCAAAGAALALAGVVSATLPVYAQPLVARMQHLDPQEMSAADRATVQARHSEIMESAEIYGYNLMAGNWTYRQTVCSPMPDTILLHYSERFSDGTESLFTALVPRGQGRVRVVPVLYRNATPFVPAPRNPRNYALFNSLVPQNIAAEHLASSRNWIELSACYAELTGADITIPAGESVMTGVAGAPTATIQVDPKRKTSLVTFADRQSERTFRVWSISYNREGRVTAAGTEVYPVNSSNPVTAPSVMAAQTPETESKPVPPSQPAEASVPVRPATEPQPATPAKASTMAAKTSPIVSAPEQEAPAKAVAQASPSETTEPGWKFIPQAPQPPSKFIPDAPQPPSKIVPQPPNQ
ncbi:MAG TPA: hypothetical protein VME86_13120 [Acidobacteriaceae bacterium]|nr:hypothetical protein [Acidobacteriaceae bacterium]